MPPIIANPEPLTRKAIDQSVLSGQCGVSKVFGAAAPVRLWHLASLDAPTVAVVWALAFAWCIRVRLPFWAPVLLALVAWAVYIGDRLLDTRSARRTARSHRLRERHIFHWSHRRILIPAAIAAACAAAWIVFFRMPLGIRERDSVPAAAAFAYFAGVHTQRKLPRFVSRFVSKELLVGLLFTIACVLPAWSRITAHAGSSIWDLLGTGLFFAVLAWLNCFAIERWESSENSSRIVEVFAPCIAVALAGSLLAIILSFTQQRPAALVAAGAASALLLAVLDRTRSRLTPIALRAAADLVLLTPLALLLR